MFLYCATYRLEDLGQSLRFLEGGEFLMQFMVCSPIHSSHTQAGCFQVCLHGLQKQFGLWTKQCLACQKAEIQRHVKAPIISYPPPDRHFDCVNIDIVGPLAPSEGNRFLLIMVDRFTRWPEAIPLKEVTTLACAKAFFATWVSRFGVPTHLLSDRGPQFISQLWSSIHQQLGICLHHTTAYHPQANGLVERFYRQLKTALMTRLTGANRVDELP